MSTGRIRLGMLILLLWPCLAAAQPVSNDERRLVTSLDRLERARAAAAEWDARRSGGAGDPPLERLLTARAAIDRMPGGRSGPPLPEFLRRTMGLPGPAPSATGGPVVMAPQPPTFDPWTSLGPGNIGGRTRALVISPAGVIWAGASGGGVWRSTDDGASWQDRSNGITNLAVTALALDPIDANVIYAATGEGFSTFDGTRGVGLFRSDDAGASWTKLGDNSNNGDFHRVSRIAFLRTDALDDGRLLAATTRGLFRSIDRGATWSRRQAGNFVDVIAKREGSLDLVFAYSSNGQLFRSADGGTNFTNPSTFPIGAHRAVLTFGPLTTLGRSVFGITINAQGAFTGLYDSPDDGVNWERDENNGPADNGKFNRLMMSNPRVEIDLNANGRNDCDGTTPVTPNSTALGYYHAALGVVPNSRRVWIGGWDLWRGDIDFLLDFKAEFGPASYGFLLPTDPDYMPYGQHAIAFPPDYGTSARIFFGTDAGIYRTINPEDSVPGPVVDPPGVDNTGLICHSGGTLSQVTYTSVNNGYQTAQFYGGGVSATGNVFIAGAQDNGIVKFDPLSPTQAWTPVLPGGDGFYTAVHATDPDILYATASNGLFFRSTNGGSSFSQAVNGITEFATMPNVFKRPVPFIMSPSDPDTLWIGGRAPYRSTDGGATWELMHSGIPLNVTSTTAWGLSQDGKLVAMASAFGEIQLSQNGDALAPTWQRADVNNPAQTVSSVAFHPTDRFRLYATYPTFSATGGQGSLIGQVWTTADARSGLGWQLATGTGAGVLPNVPVHKILIHPDEPRLMFVGTDVGVMATSDSGVTWSNVNANLPPAPVFDLQLQRPAKLFAFTHGRGAWSTTLNVPLLNVLSPDGGERLVPGTTVNVSWSASPASTDFANITHFTVDFARDGVTFSDLIAASLGPAVRSTTWNVPSAARTLTGRMRVRAFNGALLLHTDVSDGNVIVNGALVSSPGPTQIVTPTAPVTLDGSASSDQDGDPLSFNWTQLTGTAVTFTRNIPVTSFTAPSLRGDQLTFALAVFDGTENVTANTLVRVNRIPVPSAGPDRRVTPGATVTLQGTSSSDPDGQALAFTWNALSGTPGFPQTSSNAVYTAPGTRGTIEDFRVDVSDGLEASSDTVRVTVNRVPVPVVSAAQRVANGQVATVSAAASTDADFDPLTYGWTVIPSGAVAFNASLATPAFTPNLPEGTVLTFVVSVFDGVEQALANTTVTINRRPVARIVAPTAAGPSTVVQLSGATSTDGDSDALTYTWTQTGGTPVTLLPGASAAAPTFTCPTTLGEQLAFRLSVSDGIESAIANHTVRVNSAPLANPGPSRSVLPSAAVTVDGSGSSDADGEPITFSWRQVAGPAVTLTGAAGPQVSFTAPSTRGQSITLELAVSDGVQTTTSSVVIRVNRPPASVPRGPAPVLPGALVTLDGTGSSDPDGDALIFTWTQTSGSTVSLVSTSPTPSFAAPQLRGATLGFNLRVGDGLESATAPVTVRVNQLPEPILPAETPVAPGAVATLDSTRCRDRDGDSLGYQWTQTAGPAVVFDRRAAAPSFATDGMPRGTVLEFALELSDGRETASGSTSIRLNHAPQARVAGPVSAVPSEPVRVPGDASLDDDGDPLTYRWVQTSGQPVAFDPTAPALAFTAPAVGRQTLGFTLTVSDGVETSSTPFTVALSDRAYGAELGGGAGGGCEARPGSSGRPGGDVFFPWAALLFLSWRRSRRKSLSLD